ncbi:TetR/AcrR family transcriptional regulator [Gracilibacillus alcaliphilus]|uniref:TetR/AcrR family transcriptional regulator n=1 Tax=Gracilibacillus alcaliphilus TaxID=1401441 RepID=UPI00195C1AF6|nr:TetR/AcrR family transcriptional regulator [Gracilibacillus alcaliphilus]MBM7676320.1 AcrR family transcriptional regulator [Gracilibacillus alcaliphilus]
MNKKQQILLAATQSFSRYGYKATTMDRVSKIAQVGKGTIYLHFANKEELLKEIIKELAAQMRLAADQEINKHATFIDRFEAALYGILQFQERHELIIKLSDELKDFRTPIVKKVLADFEQEICLYIEEKVEKAIQKQEIKPCDPKLTAFLMYKTYIHLVNDWKENHQPLSREQVVYLIRFYFLEGLKPAAYQA